MRNQNQEDEMQESNFRNSFFIKTEIEKVGINQCNPFVYKGFKNMMRI